MPKPNEEESAYITGKGGLTFFDNKKMGEFAGEIEKYAFVGDYVEFKRDNATGKITFVLSGSIHYTIYWVDDQKDIMEEFAVRSIRVKHQLSCKLPPIKNIAVQVTFESDPDADPGADNDRDLKLFQVQVPKQ